MTPQQNYRQQCSAYRAEAPKRRTNAFFWANVAPTSVERPAGYSEPTRDRLLSLPTRRAELLAKLRADRAELARREAERADYARLGITPAPSYIQTDRAIREGMETARYIYLTSIVRGEHLPLATLCCAEQDIRWSGLLWRDAA